MAEANAWRRSDSQPVIAHRVSDSAALHAWLDGLGQPLTFISAALDGADPVSDAEPPMVATRDGSKPAESGGFVTYDGVEFEVMGPTAFWLRHVNVAVGVL